MLKNLFFSRRFEMSYRTQHCSSCKTKQKAEIKYLEYFTDITNGLWRQSRHLLLNDRWMCHTPYTSRDAWRWTGKWTPTQQWILYWKNRCLWAGFGLGLSFSPLRTLRWGHVFLFFFTYLTMKALCKRKELLHGDI